MGCCRRCRQDCVDFVFMLATALWALLSAIVIGLTSHSIVICNTETSDNSATETVHGTTAWPELNQSSDTAQETTTSAWPELNSTDAATPDSDAIDEHIINVCDYISVLVVTLIVVGYPFLALLTWRVVPCLRSSKCCVNYDARHHDSSSDDTKLAIIRRRQHL